MFKNQLQELAQQYGHNLPSYSCVREGPDHAPKFKSTVNYNGETFESPDFHNTLRQAEHSAAEAALTALQKRGRSGVLDESGSCKNLLQETAQRVGIPLPIYNTARVGPGHCPLFVCTVEFAWKHFSGEAAKTKKQAEKNSAMVAWTSLKRFASKLQASSSSSEERSGRDSEQTMVVKALLAAKSREEKSSRYSPPGPSRRRNYGGYGSPNHSRAAAPAPAYEPRHVAPPWHPIDSRGLAVHGGNEVFHPPSSQETPPMYYYHSGAHPEALYHHTNIPIKAGSSYQRMLHPLYDGGSVPLALPVPAAVTATMDEHEADEIMWLRGGPSATLPTQNLTIEDYSRGMTWPLRECNLHSRGSSSSVSAEVSPLMAPVTVRTLVPVYASAVQADEEYDHLEASTRILLNQLSL